MINSSSHHLKHAQQRAGSSYPLERAAEDEAELWMRPTKGLVGVSGTAGWFHLTEGGCCKDFHSWWSTCSTVYPFLFSISLHLPARMDTFPLGRCLAELCLWTSLLITWLCLLTLLIFRLFGENKLGECLVLASQIINYCLVVVWFVQLCSARFHWR